MRGKAAREELPRGSESILVVEDGENVRRFVVQLLKVQGYTVCETSCGEDALELSKNRKEPIHMILTDVVMPGMSGCQLAEQLRPLHPNIKVLYMSGYTDNEILHHGVLEEGISYIQKPFTTGGLASQVREVLGNNSIPAF
jgi:DNA-binding NtrC family response regulator